MHPVLAWLPFLAALVVAFAAGVGFARINEGWAASEAQSRRGGAFRAYRADVALTVTLVALLLATAIAWLVAAVVLLRFA
ncbi:MAG: hypothetical protein KIS78_30690 [Labilithrix sp.]|nr:hypothetical protein [Labilithrix sp.]MCW5836803.1 hypothetical protein [Labilithrix sp.]